MNTSLLKKTGLYFVGNFSSKILMALIIPIYAFYVSSEDLGNFDYTQTLMSIFVPIIFLTIWDAVLKYSIDEKYDKSTIINNVIAFTGVGTIAILLVGVIISYYYNMEYSILIIIMFLAYGYAQIWQYFARGLGKTKLYVLSGIISIFVNIIFLAIFVIAFKMGLLGLYISYIASQLTVVTAIEIQLGLLQNFRIKMLNTKVLKEMLFFSAPLTLNTISSWMFNGFSRFIIRNKLGAFESGLYAFSGKFAIVITMFGSVITMAVIEEAIISRKNADVISQIESRDNKEGKSAEDLFFLIMSIAIIAMPSISAFYDIISDSEYYSSLMYVPILLFYAVMSTIASNIGAQFQALEKTKYQFITTIIGSGVTAILAFLLIEKYGIFIVATAQAIGALIMVISRYILVNRYMFYRFNFLRMALITVIFVLISFISIKVSMRINIVVFLVSIAMCAFFNKEWIVRMIIYEKQRLKRNHE